MDTRAWLVVVAVIALVLAAGGACCCAGFGYLMATTPDAELEDERAQREGMAEGQRGTTDGCIVASHARTLACGLVDPDCTLGAQAFLRACLRAVPSPDASICDGVPAPSTLGDWGFADQLCARHGWASDGGECDPIAEALSVHCHGQ